MKIGLAISAGGLRGVIAIQFLIEVMKQVKKPAHEVFSLVSGTSTGAIIAGLLCRNHTPEQIMGHYYDLGSKVFPKDITGKLRQLYTVRYDIYKLTWLLDSLFKGARLRDAYMDVMMPTVDGEKVTAEHLKSYHEWWETLPFATACASSAAAQTYFKALPFTQNGQFYRMVDGGNFSGNPSDDLVSEMRDKYPNEELFVLNLGVGRLSAKARQPLKDGGAATWVGQLFRASSEPQDDNATKKCKRALGDNFQYLDVELPYIPELNDARRSTLDYLVAQTKTECYRQRERIYNIANILNLNA